MVTEVRVPKLGLSMKKGRVTKWLIAEGSPVVKDKPLLELETDKINAVIDAPASGVLGRVVAPAGSDLPVGALLAMIGEAGDTYPAVSSPPAGSAPPPTRTDAGAPAPTERGTAGSSTGGGGESLASPAARRVAKELGIDISLVPPSAPGKRITTAEVEAYAAQLGEAGAAPEDADMRHLPFEGIRRAVADNLTASLQAMAQVTISREAQVRGLVERRRELVPGFEAASGLHLTYTDLLAYEVSRLLLQHPMLNARLEQDSMVVPNEVHLGVAVALEDGLIVPVVRDAQAKSLLEIAASRAELSAKALSGALSLNDIEGGTFTISNLGAFGADVFTPIVNPPQCAILGVGRIVDNPVAADGQVVICPTMWLSLTFDHRLVDGAPAARFLSDLAERLR